MEAMMEMLTEKSWRGVGGGKDGVSLVGTPKKKAFHFDHEIGIMRNNLHHIEGAAQNSDDRVVPQLQGDKDLQLLDQLFGIAVGAIDPLFDDALLMDIDFSPDMSSHSLLVEEGDGFDQQPFCAESFALSSSSDTVSDREFKPGNDTHNAPSPPVEGGEFKPTATATHVREIFEVQRTEKREEQLQQPVGKQASVCDGQLQAQAKPAEFLRRSSRLQMANCEREAPCPGSGGCDSESGGGGLPNDLPGVGEGLGPLDKDESVKSQNKMQIHAEIILNLLKDADGDTTHSLIEFCELHGREWARRVLANPTQEGAVVDDGKIEQLYNARKRSVAKRFYDAFSVFEGMELVTIYLKGSEAAVITKCFTINSALLNSTIRARMADRIREKNLLVSDLELHLGGEVVKILKQTTTTRQVNGVPSNNAFAI